VNHVLRALVDTRQQIQKARVQFGSRVFALEKGSDADSLTGQQLMLRGWRDTFLALEQALDNDIADIVEEEPIYPSLSAVKGIAQGLAAKLVAMIDIERAETASALWQYAGYGQSRYWIGADGSPVAMKEGWRWMKKKGTEEKERTWVVADPEPGWTLEWRTDRPLAGWCLPYNKRLKTTCYLVASSFLKCGSPYRNIYDEARQYYAANRPDWSKLHQHRAAMRKCIKIFLCHLWLRWRMIEGLPISEPYVHNILGHAKLYTPEEFGWPSVGAG